MAHSSPMAFVAMAAHPPPIVGTSRLKSCPRYIRLLAISHSPPLVSSSQLNGSFIAFRIVPRRRFRLHEVGFTSSPRPKLLCPFAVCPPAPEFEPPSLPTAKMAPSHTPTGARRTGPSPSQENKSHSAKTGAGVASHKTRFMNQPAKRDEQRRESKRFVTIPPLEKLEFVYGHPNGAPTSPTAGPGGPQGPANPANDTAAAGTGKDTSVAIKKEDGDGIAAASTGKETSAYIKKEEGVGEGEDGIAGEPAEGLQMKTAAMPPEDSPEKARKVVSNVKLQRILGRKWKKR
ncbi:hypothetical protein Ptr902_00917 [Pyrenophora tritici-repentis]|nr:hypothetical protein Ptr902_00917 [Pyrenophora tritici-repentis]